MILRANVRFITLSGSIVGISNDNNGERSKVDGQPSRLLLGR